LLKPLHIDVTPNDETRSTFKSSGTQLYKDNILKKITEHHHQITSKSLWRPISYRRWCHDGFVQF